MKLLSNAILQRNPDYVSLVQITDLHLFSDTNKSIHGVNTQSSFDSVLSVATQVFDSPDLMLFTGYPVVNFKITTSPEIHLFILLSLQ